MIDIEQTVGEATLHHRAGELEKAERLYRMVLQAVPDHWNVNHNLGVLLIQAGQSKAAVPYLKRAWEGDPAKGEYWLGYAEGLLACGSAHEALGIIDEGRQRGLHGRTVDALRERLADVVNSIASAHPQSHFIGLFSAGRYTEAEVVARQMTQTRPDDGFGWKCLGTVLTALERSEEALPALRKALQLRPHDAEVFNSMGRSLHVLRQFPDAEASFRQALKLNPDLALAHNNLGSLLRELGRLAEAEGSYRRALELNPDLVLAHNNLGNTCRALGRLGEAESSYRRALTLQPEFFLAYYNLATTLHDLGRVSEAAETYRRAIELKPDFHLAHNNLGNVLCELGQLCDATASYRRAIELKPSFYPAYANLANALQAQGRLLEAEACCRRALELDPDFYEAHNNLANALKDQGRLAEAELSCRQALELNPGSARTCQALAMIKAYQSDFTDVKALSDRALSLLSTNKPDRYAVWENRLYILSYHPDLSAQQIYDEFARWGDLQDRSAVSANHTNKRTLKRRLRVGYVSPDFRQHTSRFYFEPLFASHDRNQVELFAYSNVKGSDEHTDRFKTLFDHWRDISAMSDEAADALVRRDGIDILVDGCNHMRDDRLGLFALKPAPVQVTWLGSAWTTGLATVDYVLFDPHLAPRGTLAREAIVRLPRTFVTYRPRIDADAIADAPCLRNGFATFGYFGRTERLNHRVFRLWGRILDALPQTKLILDFRSFRDITDRNYYAAFLAKHGVDTSRVVMRYSSNVWRALNDIDVMLDSFPHSGGTMIYDSIWMGVPLLTLAARPPLGRIGASIMSNLGLSDWVAEDENAYVTKATAFSRDLTALANLRRSMRERIANSPLRDEEGFARAVERAYREMWQRYCAGKAPAAFDVTPDLKVRRERRAKHV